MELQPRSLELAPHPGSPARTPDERKTPISLTHPESARVAPRLL